MRLKPVNGEQAIYSVYYFRKIPNISEYQNIKKKLIKNKTKEEKK